MEQTELDSSVSGNVSLSLQSPFVVETRFASTAKTSTHKLFAVFQQQYLFVCEDLKTFCIVSRNMDVNGKQCGQYCTMYNTYYGDSRCGLSGSF